jgi:hypothetical protein
VAIIKLFEPQQLLRRPFIWNVTIPKSKIFIHNCTKKLHISHCVCTHSLVTLTYFERLTNTNLKTRRTRKKKQKKRRGMTNGGHNLEKVNCVLVYFKIQWGRHLKTYDNFDLPTPRVGQFLGGGYHF